MAQSDPKPLTAIDPLNRIPPTYPPAGARPTLGHDLTRIIQQVAHGGGNYSIHHDYDGRLKLSLEFGYVDSRDLKLDPSTRLNGNPIYTDNTNFPNPLYPPNPIVPAWPVDTLPRWVADPNRMPDELAEQLKAMRQNGEDVEAVIRRLMSFAEQMSDLLDQARTGGMNV